MIVLFEGWSLDFEHMVCISPWGEIGHMMKLGDKMYFSTSFRFGVKQNFTWNYFPKETVIEDNHSTYRSEQKCELLSSRIYDAWVKSQFEKAFLE